MKTILGIAAHPDDLDFAAGGTIAKFAAEGATVYYLMLTNGSRGSNDTTVSARELTNTRQHEQQIAAKALGVQEVFFLNYEDGALENTVTVRKDIVRKIRELKPDTVVTMDPSVLYAAKLGFINHPDHRAAGQATLDAVYPYARNHLSYPELLKEGLQPHCVKTVLLTNFEKHDYCVDITDTIKQKEAAIKAHVSQTGGIKAVQPLLKKLTTEAGEAIGCKCGESFVRIDITD